MADVTVDERQADLEKQLQETTAILAEHTRDFRRELLQKRLEEAKWKLRTAEKRHAKAAAALQKFDEQKKVEASQD
jgi:hypothetical protein